MEAISASEVGNFSEFGGPLSSPLHNGIPGQMTLACYHASDIIMMLVYHCQQKYLRKSSRSTTAFLYIRGSGARKRRAEAARGSDARKRRAEAARGSGRALFLFAARPFS